MSGRSWYDATFDQVVTGLAAQGFQRSGVEVDDEFRCRYRDEEGRRCAVGQLLPDELCPPEIENHMVIALPAAQKDHLLGDLGGLDGDELRYERERRLNFLRDLQYAHDDGTTPEAMRVRLLALAMRWDLNLSPEVTRLLAD